ncbi:reverse transcriptase domain-containing protein [Tanacetum coccineum]
MIRGYRSRKRPREQAEQWLDNEISFPSTSGCQLVDSPIILEALIEGYLVQKIYVDGGSSSEVMYEHCFPNLRAKTREKLKESRTPLVGFSGEVSYLIGTINLNVTMGESKRLRTIVMEFVVVKSHSPYNVILGRTGLRSLGAVGSTIHTMIKFPTTNGIAIVTTKKETLHECRRMEEAQEPIREDGVISKHQILKERSAWAEKKNENIVGKDKHPKGPLESKPPEKVVIHNDYVEQTITIGGTLLVEYRSGLIEILQKHADAFAWTVIDMTGIPRFIAEHELKTYPHIEPMVQRKWSIAPDRRKVVKEEVAE